MAYSFTEKKRIRKDFRKQTETMEVPYLLTTHPSVPVNTVAELIALRTLTEATLDFPDEEVDFLQAANAFPSPDDHSLPLHVTRQNRLV